jgi:hypothetical protein
MENSEFEDNVLFPVGISLKSVLSILPTATILIDLQGNIQYANVQSLAFFRFPNHETLYQKKELSSMLVDSQLNDIFFEEIASSKANLEKVILIRRFDKSVSYVNLFAQYFKSDFEGIILQFTDVSAKTVAFLTEKVRVLRNEIHSLKPYLNKPGKDLLENIVSKDLQLGINEINEKVKLQFNLLDNNKTNQLLQHFPLLTDYEISICGLLSLKLSFEEIASITGKTSNSLRVTYHRLLKRTNYTSGKDLLRKLESIN